MKYGSSIIVAIVSALVVVTTLYCLVIAPLNQRINTLESEIMDMRLDQSDTEIHTKIISWNPLSIDNNTMITEYVASVTVVRNNTIRAIQVMMDNPIGILWEGDVYVMMNNLEDFSTDQVIVHYHVDKHVENTSSPQIMFDLDNGFRVMEDDTIYVYRIFKNISNQTVDSGDGEVIMYYTRN